MKRKRFALLLLVVALAALLPVAVFAQANDTIVIRGFGNITTFNPELSNDGASFQALSLLWPAPFMTDSFTGAAVPGLTSWTISDDGLTYTFKIKDDAVWSDGTPITSDDMIFAIDAIMSDKVDTVLESNVASIDHVDKVDDKTYERRAEGSRLRRPERPERYPLPALGKITLPTSATSRPISRTPTPDISGGPYILDSSTPDESQTFHANPTYFDGAPKIPYLVNKVIGDQAVAVQSIQSGDIDYTYFQGDLFQQIADKSKLQYQSFPALVGQLPVAELRRPERSAARLRCRRQSRRADAAPALQRSGRA